MEDFQLFKLRDIGAAMNDTISFIQKDKQLIRKILTIIVPLYAIIGIFMGFMMEDVTLITNELSKQLTSGGGFNEEVMEQFKMRLLSMDYTKMGILYLLIIFSSMLMNAVINSFSFNYVKARANNETLEDAEINVFFTKDIIWYIGYSLLLGFVMMIGMGILALIIGGVSMASKGLGVLLIFPMMIGFFYFSINYLTLFFPVCFMEDLGFGAALSRAGALTKGHFWETLGLLLLMGLAIGIGTSMVAMAMRGIGSAFGTLGGSLLVQIVQYALTGAAMVFMHVCYALWYGNLKYQLEGGSMSSSGGGYNDLIDQIGKKDF